MFIFQIGEQPIKGQPVLFHFIKKDLLNFHPSTWKTERGFIHFKTFSGLVDPAAGARMSLAESLTNLVWAPISQLRDVKCSCNYTHIHIWSDLLIQYQESLDNPNLWLRSFWILKFGDESKLFNRDFQLPLILLLDHFLGNWMWPGKLPGEDADLVDACSALCQSMIQLGIAVDGGKDSLSMAARVGSQMIKSPSTVVISTSVNQFIFPTSVF